MSGTAEPSPFVFDTTTETFEADVIARSAEVPVIVDFWAPWCGPCRQLGPVLEKLAAGSEGKFLLAKVNIDQSPEVAGQFGVRSIPAVFAVRDGQVADGFVGVQPESAIRSWIDQLMPTVAELLAKHGETLEAAGDFAEAEAKYGEALAQEPELPQAAIGLARVALERGDFDAARARIAALEGRGYLEPEAEKVKAEITLRSQTQGAGTVDTARASLAEAPDDPARKFALAEALTAAGQYAEALAVCLDLVERDRKGFGEQARKTMIAIFQLLPPDSDLVTDYRRQLSFAL